MYDQNRFAESAQIDAMYLMSCFFVCICLCLIKSVVTRLVSMYFVGVESSLFTIVQSFYTCLSMVFGYGLLLS